MILNDIKDNSEYEVENPFTKETIKVNGKRLRIWINVYGFEVEIVTKDKPKTKEKSIGKSKEKAIPNEIEK